MLTVRKKNFDWANIPLVECLEGNAMDTHYTLKLYQKFWEEVEANGMEKIITHLLSPATELFAESEFKGIDIDEEALDQEGNNLLRAVLNAEEVARQFREVPTDSNLRSSDDLADVLYFLEDGFTLYPADLTDKGKPSTSTPTLKLLQRFINEELDRRGC